MKRTLLSMALLSVFSMPTMAEMLPLPTVFGSILDGEYVVDKAEISLTQDPTERSPKYYKVGKSGASISLSTNSTFTLDDKTSGHSRFFSNIYDAPLTFVGNGHALTFKHNSISTSDSNNANIATFYGKGFHFSGLSNLEIDNVFETTEDQTQSIGYGLYLDGDSSILSSENHVLNEVKIGLTSKKQVNQLNAIGLGGGKLLTDAGTVKLKVTLNEHKGRFDSSTSSGIAFKNALSEQVKASFINNNPDSILDINVTSTSGSVAAISYENDIKEAIVETNELKATVTAGNDSRASGLYIDLGATITEGSLIEIDANSSSFTVSAGHSYGIDFYKGTFNGKVKFSGQSDFNVTGQYATGISCDNQDAEFIFANDARFMVHAKESATGLDLFNQYGSAPQVGYQLEQSTMTFNGNVFLEVTSENPEAKTLAIDNTGGTIVMGMTEDHTQTNGKTVQITGDILSRGMTGASDKYSKESGTVLIGLSGQDSFLKGKVTDAHMAQDDYRTELFIENGAKWDVTGDSQVGAIHANGGQLNFANTDSTVAINDLTVTDKGLSVYLTEVGDTPRVTVTDVTGNGTIGVEGSSSLNDSYANVDELVEDLAGAIVQKDVAGTDKVVTNQVTADGGKIRGEITSVLGEDGQWLTTVKENVSLNGYSSIASLAAINWRHEMNDVTKRMGELRDSNGKVGAWARAYGSELEYGKQNVTSKNNSIQVGSDYAVTDEWKVGAAFNYTDGSMDFAKGSGDNKAYGLALYGTWLADNGLFLDVIGKYSRMSTDFTSDILSAGYDNNGWSLSAEFGWHYQPIDTAFIEPQVELTYGRLEGDTFYGKNGVRIEQDNFDSLIGRAGVRAGFLLPQNKGNLYAKASVAHDFDGEMQSVATLPGSDIPANVMKDDLGGTWYEFGVGANLNWTDNTYTYIDVQRTTGGEVNESWRWNVGVRYAF